MKSIEERLAHARQENTTAGFAINRAKEGIDVRPLLTNVEIAQVNENIERSLQQAKQWQKEQAERLRKQHEYQEWCAILPTIGIKVADFKRQVGHYSLAGLYADLARYGLIRHKYQNRYWITKEDAEKYLFLRKCKSKTGWSYEGRSVLQGAVPVGTCKTGYGYDAPLYSEEQTRPNRT